MFEIMFVITVALGEPSGPIDLATVITLRNPDGVTVVTAECTHNPSPGNIMFQARAPHRNFVLRGVHCWHT